MKTHGVIFLLVFILLASCSNNNGKNTPDQDKVYAQQENIKRYHFLTHFWNDIDTLHLDTVTVYKNSYQNYTQLPSLFFEMKHLKHVLLDTQIQLDTLQDDIGNLIELETLVITKSQIRYLPKTIGKLKKLKKLTIAWGGALKEIPAEIGELSQLEELDLYRNNLTTLPQEISKLKKLKRLYLGENMLSFSERKRINKLLPHCHIAFNNQIVKN